MKRSPTHSFVLTLPLVTEPWQRDRLNKDFRVACSIQNAVTHSVYTRYKQMIKTQRHRKALAAYRRASKGQKGDCAKKLQQIQYEYGLTEFQIIIYAKGARDYFRGQINSQVTQKLVRRVYTSLSKLLYGNATRMHYCRSEDFVSIEGESNQTGIRFFGDTVFYKKMQFKAVVHHEDPYIQQALSCRVKYCRLKRLMVRGKYKFYVQLILEGDPPIKIRSTGELKRPLGTGRIGLDIGTQTLAIYAKDTVRLVELADRVQSIERELRRINRAMDRSRRANNPQFFAEDGTYIRRKKGEPRREWKNSNRYEGLRLRRKELYRKQAAVRKQQHRELAARLRALGDEVFIEPMSFKGLQRKSKQCTKTKTGKNKSRKRFGKSIANRAPAMLVSMIEQQFIKTGGHLYKVDNQSVKASQFHHDTNEYIKPKLSERTKQIGGHTVQRDLYSAFLLSCVTPDLKNIDAARCEAEFPNFLMLHEQEIQRLKQNPHTLASMGIRKF